MHQCQGCEEVWSSICGRSAQNVLELYREALVLCGIMWMQLEDIVRNYFTVFLCYIDLKFIVTSFYDLVCPLKKHCCESGHNIRLKHITLGPLTKPGSDCSDRIGSDSGSDRIGFWIGLVSSLLVQKNHFDKSCFNNDTGGSDIFI